MAFSFDNIPMKTKVISILVIFLLILPGIMMPVLNQSNQQVLGASDSTLENGFGAVSSQNSGFKFPEINLPEASLQAFAPTLPNFNLGNNQPQVIQIQPSDNQSIQASTPTLIVNVNNNTVDDIRQRILEQQSPTTVQIQTGKITWEDGLGDNILSDKFPIGSKVSLKVGNKTQILVVTENRILPVNTLVIISKDKFTALFADAQKTKEVDATGEKV